jgi:hypothetical protein
VRLGIAGGLVVVGDLIGAGAAQERGLLAVVKLRTIEFRFAVDSPVEGGVCCEPVSESQV